MRARGELHVLPSAAHMRKARACDEGYPNCASEVAGLNGKAGQSRKKSRRIARAGAVVGGTVKMPKAPSEGEEMMALHIRVEKLPPPMREYRFHDARKWRIDFCWPAERIAVEVEGGIHSNGRHNRGAGFLADIEKYNELSLMGYTLLRFATEQVRDGSAIATLRRAFA